MTTIDPILDRLVSDAEAAEVSIPLVLYLPSGPVRGNTTTADDFRKWASFQLGQMSGFTGAVAVAPEREYVHLAVQSGVVAGQVEVVRVSLVDVAAWTVGSTA